MNNLMEDADKLLKEKRNDDGPSSRQDINSTSQSQLECPKKLREGPPDDAKLSCLQSSVDLETELMWSQVSLSIEQAERRRLQKFEASMLTQEQVNHYEELFSRGLCDVQDPDNLTWLTYKRASLAYHFELPPSTTFLRPEDTHVGNLLEIAECQM